MKGLRYMSKPFSNLLFSSSVLIRGYAVTRLTAEALITLTPTFFN
jgi:hypothetical protein